MGKTALLEVTEEREGLKLVREILDQLSLKDAPPSNDTYAIDQDSKASSGNPPNLATFSFETESSAVSAAECSESPAVKLGHSSLSQLCTWTLEQVGGETTVPLQIETSMLLQQLAAPSPKNKPKPKSHHRFGRHWPGKHSLAALPAPSALLPPELRLQQFGSEYARHMSTSILAPKCRPSKSRRNKAILSDLIGATDMEDVTKAVHVGAVLDIITTFGNDAAPLGYLRILSLARKKHVHVFVKKEADWDKAAQRPCVTALALIFPDRKEFVPPGFCIVRSSKGNVANLGTMERIFLCFRRSREGNPLTGIIPLYPTQADTVPDGYTVMEKSPRNHSADLNAGLGPPLFLAFRQRLANLETLRPLPLLLSIQKEPLKDVDEECASGSISSERRLLQSYYCTGGTTVPAQVGFLHIMDRSTHSLLSPSSVENRLALIGRSRRKALTIEDSKEATSDNTTADLSDNGETTLDTDCGSDAVSLSRRDALLKSLADYRKSSDTSTMASTEAPLSLEPYRPDLYQPCLLGDDDELRQCLNAMSFIPWPKCASHSENPPLRVERLRARSILLAPILTACYTRHGGSSLVAVEGMTKLISTTTFFAEDVNSCGVETGFYSSFTLLDLAIQTVCDVATAAAQETQFPACVEFIEAAVTFSQCNLATRTIGYIVRFYLFIFYFDASIPTMSPFWQSSRAPGGDECDALLADSDILSDPRRDGIRGGAPQSAALAFKHLISLSIVRMGKISVNGAVLLSRSQSSCSSPVEGSGCCKNLLNTFFDDIMVNVMNDAVNHVETANYIQLALHQVHRSGGSELFWHDMNSVIGLGLFGKDESLGDAGQEAYILNFALLANLIKVAFGKAKVGGFSSEMLPRDVASKLLSLELLLHFLECWSDEQEAVEGCISIESFGSVRSNETLAYCVRRMVVPCLLSNTLAGLVDLNIFRRILRIISELWASIVFRKHCKAELGVLIEHFAVNLLHLGPENKALAIGDQCSDDIYGSLLNHQVSVVREIRNWFSVDREDVLEFYVNWNTDFSSQPIGSVNLPHCIDMKLFERLGAGLSGLAEQCGEIIGNEIADSRENVMSSSGRQSLLHGGRKDENYQRAKARTTIRLLRKASLDTLLQVVKSVAAAAAAVAGIEFSSLLHSWTGLSSQFEVESASLATDVIENGKDPEVSVSDEEVQNFWLGTISGDFDAPDRHLDTLEVAAEIADGKNLKKAVEYLIACNVITSTPRDIATFLRLHNDRWDPIALGNYLGEGGIGSAESEYWNSIRHIYIRANSFVGFNVEEALRHFLTDCGFQLPAEAQKIDRLIVQFAQCYYEDNAGDTVLCPFSNEDTVYVLAFAVLMLNTDLHKATASAQKSVKRMTKLEFINNLRGVDQDEDLSRDYLSDVYDSIEANPIALHEGETVAKHRHSIVQGMVDNVRGRDSLLRSLAVHDFHFVTIDEVRHVAEGGLCNLVQNCVAKTWHHWHGVINTGLDMAHLDPQGMRPSVEILLYSIAICCCLDLPTERIAFLNQLERLVCFEKTRHDGWVFGPQFDTPCVDDWYEEVRKACNRHAESKLWALRSLRQWTDSLQEALSADVKTKVDMTKAITKIRDGDHLLLDPARSFIRSGILTKKSGRTGRCLAYQFFLFSDVLLYARREDGGDYNIHEELPLHLLKVVDWFPPIHKNRQTVFELYHPRKKFLVICSSLIERQAWVRDIRSAVSVEIHRKLKAEAARAAAHGTQTGT